MTIRSCTTQYLSREAGVHQIKKISVSAALFATISCMAAPGFAQSLALTYKLVDARPDTTQQAPTAMNRCAGFNWMISIGACGRELLTRIAPARGTEGYYSAATVIESVATAPDLPSLGTSVAEPRVRSVGGREAVIGSTRSADVLLRLGSQYRLKGNEEGMNAYKFTDANYESHVQNNGHKAVGVELLVPFQ